MSFYSPYKSKYPNPASHQLSQAPRWHLSSSRLRGSHRSCLTAPLLNSEDLKVTHFVSSSDTLRDSLRDEALLLPSETLRHDPGMAPGAPASACVACADWPEETQCWPRIGHSRLSLASLTASCPALGPASTASHSQQPQQPPGAGRASLHSLTEATLGKYFSQKKILYIFFRSCIANAQWLISHSSSFNAL